MRRRAAVEQLFALVLPHARVHKVPQQLETELVLLLKESKYTNSFVNDTK